MEILYFTAGSISIKLLFHAVAVLFYKRVCHADYGGSRTVIPVQNNVARRELELIFEAFIVEPRFEIDDNAHIRTAPFVDVLVRVANNKKVTVVFGKSADKLEFLNRYILKFIDHNVAELFLPLQKHVGIFAEKVDGEVYKVEEIKTEIFALLLNIAEYYCIGLALRL